MRRRRVVWAAVLGLVSLAGSGQAQQAVYEAVAGRVRLGGYGSVKFEANDLEESNAGFDFRRFVLTLDAAPAERLRFVFELEFERFTALELEREVEATEGGLKVEQAVEGSNKSEIKLEQAWVQYDLAPFFNLRVGAVLPPLGRFNIFHDDNRWNLPRRPLVDRGVPVLPAKAAWTELGAGFAGETPLGRQGLLRYELYLVNGVVLDAEVEEIAQTRLESRDKLELEAVFRPVAGPFDKDFNENKAVVGRLLLSPLLGYELAVSGYVGEYTPDFLDAEETVWSVGVDGKVSLGPLEVEGEYVFTRWENIEAVARAFARTVVTQAAATPSAASPAFESEIEFELAELARSKSGYWVELRLPFWPAALSQTVLGRGFANPQLVPVLRWEQVFFDKRVTEVKFANGVLTAFETADATLNRLTLGLAYRPTPLWVFSLAYEVTFTDADSLAGLTNFLPAQEDEDTAQAFLVGVAFGF
ncbi:MAG: hypothetical protein KatS3mg131_0730 [Candidatus Tectimicrobiota bacterium]|nr:MAG: hypothetical protein KatS3mg131_0730 [Candidatus Tectomicrobia bacterium]